MPTLRRTPIQIVNDGLTIDTLQAKTTVSGLTPGQRMYFQFRAILKDGAGTWSASVSIIVQ